MNIHRYFLGEVTAALEQLAAAGAIPSGLDLERIAIEPSRDPAHGDLATNAALVLAKPTGIKPVEMARLIADRLRTHRDVREVAVAGPGFINLRLADSFWQARITDILAAGLEYGATDIGRGICVNVEYVSANPTGPLHVGHARGAAFGDALAALLAKAGYAVTREYYINDAGGQLAALARSVYHRYREVLGEAAGPMGDGCYPGDYLIPVGQALAARDGRKWLTAPEDGDDGWREACANFGRDEMLARIKADLAELGVHFADHEFKSERALHRDGRVAQTIRALETKGLVYRGVLEAPKSKTPDDWEPREQMLFAATRFGDDVDRPLQKSNGEWTYFAADIAYHFDKIQRGFAELIDVWGADHGGYIKRMKAAVAALSDGKVNLDVKICQLVKLLRGGQEVKMSKRAGTFVTLREVVDEVGKDVVRFIMLTRKNDAPLEFDLSKVVERSLDNPVWYVQYAHARCRSAFRTAKAELPDADHAPERLAAAPLDRLGESAELALVKLLAGWPRLVEGAAQAHEPHRLAFYLYDVAGAFHHWWTTGNNDPRLRIVVAGDPALTSARLALVQATAFVIGAGLGIIGVAPLEEMR